MWITNKKKKQLCYNQTMKRCKHCNIKLIVPIWKYCDKKECERQAQSYRDMNKTRNKYSKTPQTTHCKHCKEELSDNKKKYKALYCKPRCQLEANYKYVKVDNSPTSTTDGV